MLVKFGCIFIDEKIFWCVLVRVISLLVGLSWVYRFILLLCFFVFSVMILL